MYFIGVTTTQSSIMRLFPKWSEIMGLGAELVGYDIALGAPPEDYLKIVRHVKSDPMSVGALVTTHKIDLLNATRPEFAQLDQLAQLTHEISCIAKRDGKLFGFAKDPITSGKTWESFVPDGYLNSQADVLCFGAGGAGIAISVYTAGLPDKNRPRKFILTDISQSRLDDAKAIHSKLDTAMTFEYVLNGDATVNDQLVANLPEQSVIINATGMGKDRPGSPITDAVQFPQGGIIWELNYRGERLFLQQAQAQTGEKGLIIEDGWLYFLYGWSYVVAEIFQVDLTPELFEELAFAAETIR